MKRVFLLATLLVFLVSCAPKYSLGPEMDVNEYAYVVLSDTGYDQTFKPDIESMLSGLGFRIITPEQAAELDEAQQTKVLTYTMQSFASAEEARVRIKLLDYDSKTPVYTSEGSHRAADDQKKNLLIAVQESLQGVYEAYTDFTHVPALASSDPAMKKEAVAKVASKEAPKDQDSVKNTGDAEEEEWENIPKSRKDLVKYYDKNSYKLDPIEGIWTDDRNEYTIAVFKNQVAAKRDFVGIVLSDTNKEWKTCDVQIEIKQTAHQGSYTATYYLPDRTKVGGTLAIQDSGRLHGDFENKGKDVQVAFLRNYPENFAQADAGKKRGPLSYGTGFMVDPSGYLVTNYHVVDDPGNLVVYFPTQDKEYDAELVYRDKRNDLALLRITNPGNLEQELGKLPYSLAASRNIKVGQDTFVMGFPLGSDLGRNHKVTTGNISALAGVKDDPCRMQITNPIQPGNSGGPVFNSRGEIVGVVVAGLDDKYYYKKKGFVPQNVNFAIKLSYLQGMIDMVPDAELSAAPSTQGELSMEELVEQTSPYVAQIKNYLTKREKPSAVLQDPDKKPDKKAEGANS